ncbi:hypothetical protein BCIN_12g06310 [Botrytis cinerea B05.10]|uniref:Uncharacterized protein n=3 Tax=Botryotinia fuckeliana TaxID=40559 RepID=A0A384JZS4_BOTFB|nr:hypothetical protein BCIN_12g06310 [Botrytis cinerea B05.10]ATZ56099.1 hypothetical protein BCIN_12g06310 [Botrytis cinerea B05.10]EMR90861.1 hypothetical protein BcDW1_476 [Botrytis cinerea BcDW1]CCD33636.1 hypothetical protein BofuT4_P068520.1 [Botrytis cinerea T4]
MLHRREEYPIPPSQRRFPINPKLIVILVALVLCGLFIRMDSPSTNQHDIPIQISISDITTIDSEPQSSPIIKLKVTLSNPSDKAVSFLRWSTPFDLRAVPMGIFEFKSVATGDLAPCLGLKLNRKMPREGVFSDDDIITIDAGAKETKDIEIKAPEVVLKSGEKYVVHAKGFWMHVLVGDREEAKKTEANVLREDYESEGVEFEV